MVLQCLLLHPISCQQLHQSHCSNLVVINRNQSTSNELRTSIIMLEAQPSSEPLSSETQVMPSPKKIFSVLRVQSKALSLLLNLLNEQPLFKLDKFSVFANPTSGSHFKEITLCLSILDLETEIVHGSRNRC